MTCLMHLPVQSTALKVYGAEKQEYSSVVRFLAPKLHTVLLSIVVVTTLILSVC